MENPSIRTVPMEVLALGMSRSGTESIHQALEILGYIRTYHGIRDLLGGQDGHVWSELAEMKYGKNKDQQQITRHHFDRILGDCMAVTDMPCIAFWSELMDAYPEAKILLVERDVESWYFSFYKVLSEVYSWRRQVTEVAIRIGLLPPNPNLVIDRLGLRYFRAVNAKEMMQNARSVYVEHYNAIEARAKNEGRAILRIRLERVGWEPICRFLGEERPERPFPKGNEWQKIVAFIKIYQWKSLWLMAWNLAKVLAGISLGVAIVALLVRRLA